MGSGTADKLKGFAEQCMAEDDLNGLSYDEMTPEQKTMIEHLLSGPRAGANGPFNVLLRSPEMGDLAQQFGASTRFKSSVPPKLNELAIIITARYWTSQYGAPSRGAPGGPEPGDRGRDRARQTSCRDAERRRSRLQLLF